MKTCTKCAARLPLRFFPLINHNLWHGPVRRVPLRSHA